MGPSPTWLEGQTASTPEELEHGDGCHPDETQALNDYLNNIITIEKAAEKIVNPILSEARTAEKTFRLWALLCEALVELNKEDRLKTLGLLSQIRTLPATSDIDWAALPGFASMWGTLYCSHLYAGDPPGIRLAIANFDEESLKDFRLEFEAVGQAEAKMLVRGFDKFTSEDSAYKVLDLVLSDRPGVEVYVSQILGWLDVVGERLKEKAMSEDALAEKWARWKEALLGLSQDGSRLSAEGRRVAAQCHELM